MRGGGTIRCTSIRACWPCIIINDLVSLAKEKLQGQAALNIVGTVAHQEHLNPVEALAHVWELYERTICLMQRLQRQLLDDPRPAVARYASELPYWLPSTINFTATSTRYLQLPAAEGRPPQRITAPTISTTDTPVLWDPDDLTPPPHPAIAWWWDQLT
ncbi:terpene synthase family protein [Streptomyces sp. NPDC091272]|uniref:terpene synthase family protein n=1 Tax=Streptomyces sp. NPDC091272 TaxID=3365981 RepID=UPI0037F7AE93